MLETKLKPQGPELPGESYSRTDTEECKDCLTDNYCSEEAWDLSPQRRRFGDSCNGETVESKSYDKVSDIRWRRTILEKHDEVDQYVHEQLKDSKQKGAFVNTIARAAGRIGNTHAHHPTKVKEGLPTGGIPKDGLLSSDQWTGRKGRRQKNSAKLLDTKYQAVSTEKENIEVRQDRVKDGLHGDSINEGMPENVNGADVYGTGLRNEVGEYNCFLNVIIQWWKHLKMGIGVRGMGWTIALLEVSHDASLHWELNCDAFECAKVRVSPVEEHCFVVSFILLEHLC
ncbi:hypothetical protein LOK49_LG14G00804 [Camellia lanceoleosa]|uniref:Uncharacterized protein n=1 Tax=Camellia lanceoleosa TaxID=1840588 RepID=A0ACC0FAM0_9ERIC|nr:hypothetical protein LOK49_LG14G00804 [Camellia lanceoleosa]